MQTRSSTRKINMLIPRQPTANEVPPSSKKSLYGVLELPDFASITEVRAAYKRLALISHPDKGGSEEAFKALANAYYVLGDEERKNKYDAKLRSKESESEDYSSEAQYASDDFYEFMSKFEDQMFDYFRDELNRRKNEKTNISLSRFNVPIWDPFYKNAGKEGQIYYMLGNPILISEGCGMLRAEIPEEEIVNSFKNLDQVLLLDSESSAYNYSQAKRTGNIYQDDNCQQSFYAKVMLNRSISVTTKRLQVWINEKHNGSQIQGDHAVFCFDAHRVDVTLLLAKLNIFTLDHRLSREYLPVNLQQDDNQPVAKRLSRHLGR